MSHQARTGDGKVIEPGAGAIPILKQLEPGRLLVIGTGFYITRYGLFVTAAHVIEGLADPARTQLNPSFVMHLGAPGSVHLRRIVSASFLNNADVAVGQADNYLSQYPSSPLMNLRGSLTSAGPPLSSILVTYAYPENEILDFTNEHNVPVIAGNYFDGVLLKHVTSSSHPFIPYEHFETSIPIRSGASGGPVFNSRGQIIGVNCRGWDFSGAEHDGNHLSYVIPVSALSSLELALAQLPPMSWEAAQVPEHRRNGTFTFADLAAIGHIDLC